MKAARSSPVVLSCSALPVVMFLRNVQAAELSLRGEGRGGDRHDGKACGPHMKCGDKAALQGRRARSKVHRLSSLSPGPQGDTVLPLSSDFPEKLLDFDSGMLSLPGVFYNRTDHPSSLLFATQLGVKGCTGRPAEPLCSIK